MKELIRWSRVPKLELFRSPRTSSPQPGGFHQMSVMDTNKLRARVATLDKLLDDFDGQLDDLLAQSLPETLLGLDTLQQAKLQVTIPYLVYDLVIS